MLAAILLIGFTISKVSEKNFLRERVRYAEGVVQDFQAVIDFLVRERKEVSLTHSAIQQEILEFARLFMKERALHELLIVDPEFRIIASRNKEHVNQRTSNEWLKLAIQSGQLHTEIETAGGFFYTQYKKLVLTSPLWIRGKISGGMQVEIPMEEVMAFLLESQKVILLTIILDAIVLIVFGSFLLSRVLVKPLKDLVRFTQKISEGDFSQKIEGTSKNEIGQLIGSFNRMIDKLAENQESLENYLTSLESTNKKLVEAQEELTRTEKLASIGRFAAGVDPWLYEYSGKRGSGSRGGKGLFEAH